MSMSMKVEAVLSVRGPVYQIPQGVRHEELSPGRVYFTGDIPGAMLFVGGHYAGRVIDLRAHGETHHVHGPSGYASPEEFTADEIEIRCILEWGEPF